MGSDKTRSTRNILLKRLGLNYNNHSDYKPVDIHYSNKPLLKSNSWVDCRPKPKATNRHNVYFNKGGYKVYSIAGGRIWLLGDDYAKRQYKRSSNHTKINNTISNQSTPKVKSSVLPNDFNKLVAYQLKKSVQTDALRGYY